MPAGLDALQHYYIASLVADHMSHTQQGNPGCTQDVPWRMTTTSRREMGGNVQKQKKTACRGQFLSEARSHRTTFFGVDIFRADSRVRLHQQSSQLSTTLVINFSRFLLKL